MKKLLLFLSALTILSASAAEQILSQSVTANTPVSLLSGAGYAIKEIYFQNADTTNTAVIKVYDSSNTTTNYVVGATTTYSVVSTNFSTTWTNEAGIVLTNIFNGYATVATTVSAATNERPKIVQFTVPKADNRAIQIQRIPLRGLLLLSDQSGIVEIVYEKM